MARKKGSGRTKGATSCVRVSLKDLCNVLRSEEATVVVSRRWALQVGINARYEISDMDCKPMYADTKTIEALGSAVDLNIEGDVELVVSDLMEEREEKEVLDW
jgi:hypothetical protein